MKITKDLANKLLQESQEFRNHVLEQLGWFDNSLLVDNLILHAQHTVKRRAGENVSPKVAAIRAIKDYATNHADEMEKEFPDAILQLETGRVYCSLSWARKFAEQHQDQIQY